MKTRAVAPCHGQLSVHEPSVQTRVLHDWISFPINTGFLNGLSLSRFTQFADLVTFRVKMKVTLVCLALVALAAAAYAVPLPQDPSGYDPSLEELLEDKRGEGKCRYFSFGKWVLQ